MVELSNIKAKTFLLKNNKDMRNRKIDIIKYCNLKLENMSINQ